MTLKAINGLPQVKSYIKPQTKPETQTSKEVIKSVQLDVECALQEGGIIKFGGKTFTRDIDDIGNPIYEDEKGGKIDINDYGVRSFNGRNFRIYFHKNGNHNYIHKENGLLFNEGNGFPNGVKKILTTINHKEKGKLIKFLIEKDGTKQYYYLNQEGKILDEKYCRIDSTLVLGLEAIGLMSDYKGNTSHKNRGNIDGRLFMEMSLMSDNEGSTVHKNKEGKAIYRNDPKINSNLSLVFDAAELIVGLRRNKK